jgi:hypothetical protein
MVVAEMPKTDSQDPVARCEDEAAGAGEQPEDQERLTVHLPSFGRLLMEAPLEPGDLPERDRTPMRDVAL